MKEERFTSEDIVKLLLCIRGDLAVLMWSLGKLSELDNFSIGQLFDRAAQIGIDHEEFTHES